VVFFAAGLLFGACQIFIDFSLFLDVKIICVVVEFSLERNLMKVVLVSELYGPYRK
jgi:hypothetical protein